MRTGVELSTSKVKTIKAPGAIVDVILSTSCKNSDGDTRVRMADQSGWCTLTFRAGEPLIEPLGTSSHVVSGACFSLNPSVRILIPFSSVFVGVRL